MKTDSRSHRSHRPLRHSGDGDAKSPLEGRWKKGNLVIQIAPCGGDLCGTVVKASAKQQAKAERGSGTDLIGARLIQDIDRTGPNTYRASVFVPDRNMHARGTIRQVSANALAVKGCVLGVDLQVADLAAGPLAAAGRFRRRSRPPAPPPAAPPSRPPSSGRR